MKERKLIYHYLDLVQVSDIKAVIKNKYKIKLVDTVKCYYVKIPGYVGKNVVAKDQKTVESHFKIKPFNITNSVCRVMEIDVDLTEFDLKKVARENQEQYVKNVEKRLSMIPSWTLSTR